MEAQIITDLRSLRRAVEGGASVEKIVWRQGTTPPPELWRLIRRFQLPFQQVPASALPLRREWLAYVSPVSLHSLDEWLAEVPDGVGVALVGITDARNVGAIFRSAAAFGVKWTLIRSEGSPLLSTEGIWRASAGTLTRLSIVKTKKTSEALKQLRRRGWSLLATRPWASSAMAYWEWDWRKPTILLFGEEEKGLPQEYIQLCDAQVCIPHESTVESLNVSVAAGILLSAAYLARRASIQSHNSPS
ncbi:MAG: RNA methyltransferase [Bacteroidia bacterium]|nr:RNA methyltransferase [Bacteroidia bacterium]